MRCVPRRNEPQRRTGAAAIQIGSNRWYVTQAKTARLVFKVRGGKLGELGVANETFTSTRAKARRTLSSWRLR